MRYVCNNKHRHFMTNSDNVLNVGEQAGGEERAGRPHPCSEGLLEGTSGGKKNSAAAEFAEALRSDKSVVRNTLRSLAAI